MEFKGHLDQHFGHLTYSQHGEDLMICNLFALMKIKNPSYLDIGAHHPFNISNTALLYARGSRGVNVEANPNLIYEFKKNRPLDKTLSVGIGIESAYKDFYMFDDFSGLNTFVKDEAFKINKVINLYVCTMNDIVNVHCEERFPDFLTMDVEGLDYNILRYADFSKSNPKIICVEVRKNDTTKFQKMMGKKEYFLHCRMGENLIFIKERYINEVY